MQYSLARATKFDRFLWPLIRFAWEPFSRKNSHFWHWHNCDPKIMKNTISIEADSGAGQRLTVWQDLIQTNFRWHKVALISPLSAGKPFQVGYRYLEEGVERCKMCDVILDRPFAMLCGPYDADIFAVTPHTHKPVTLKVTGYSTKQKLPKDLFLV